ncbi:putative late blight resistance proteinR1A-10 [Abeliophyllum distichum]|uniref:Late blight resistance proteinR1A-10 n=1 Tax=Abeliophyllum distichum TaxID=126358 RepID=A0ABD1QV49_9LAMI
MHDLLRKGCMRMAHEENFLYVKSRYLRIFPEEASFRRHLSIHDDASNSCSEDDIKLRRFPEEILQLVNLRYIAIACHAKVPPSIAVLWNLQTLIVEDPLGIACKLPMKIWNMLQLRHLKFSRVGFYFSSLARRLENLLTLSMIDNLDYNHIIIRTPNLNKLGIHYNPDSSHSLDHFVHLQKLETLKILFDSPANSTFNHISLPSNLKKITLEGGRIDWKNMRIFGSLPNLEVLKLHDFAFLGQRVVTK